MAPAAAGAGVPALRRRGNARLPHGTVLAAYVTRGAILWAMMRTLVTLVLLLAGADPLVLPLGSVLLVIALALAADVAETTRRREWALIGNLGIGRIGLAMMFALPALLGEIVLGVIGAVMR